MDMLIQNLILGANDGNDYDPQQVSHVAIQTAQEILLILKHHLA